VVNAQLKGPVARWDGTSQRILGLRDRLALGSLQGSIPGLSLLLVITARNGAPLYTQRAGIELLAGFGLNDGGFHRLPETELWRDPERLQRAVERALAPLLEHTGRR